MEINEKVRPPVFFTVNFDESYHWEGDHFYGCSLSAASHIVKPRGYILESLQYNNAMFVRSDVAAGHLEDKSVEIAYAAGYRDRPDRKRLFSHNSNVDCVLNYTPQKTVEFFREYFRKYDGKYTLRLKPISDCDS